VERGAAAPKHWRRPGVSIFALSTYGTDYLLVREKSLEFAVAALSERGYAVRR
jgi:hypothetical protein